MISYDTILKEHSFHISLDPEEERPNTNRGEMSDRI